MDDRFLRYAKEKGRSIRAVWIQNGTILQKTVRVVDYNEQSVFLRMSSRKTPLEIPRDDLLSCDYARGDNGED